MHHIYSWLLEFYVLEKSKVVPRCDRVHGDFIVLRNQAISTMTHYPTQSHYPDTELTSLYALLLMLSIRPGSNNYQFCKSLVWIDRESNSRPPAQEGCTLPIQAPHRDFTQMHVIHSCCHHVLLILTVWSLLLFYAIATVFQLCHGDDMMYEMRRRKP